jgi:GAF domain-containing protein
MEMVAEEARRLVDAESASVAMFVEKDLLASVTKGITDEFKRNLRWRVRPGGVTDHVLTGGRPLVIEDAPSDPRSRESSAVRIGKIKSLMAVPMLIKDEVVGVLFVGDTTRRAFDEHDLMFLTVLANHAAASIRQARLQREMEKKLEELEGAHRELVSADRLKSEFISAVTSQMRMPLDAIRTYSKTVLQRMDDESFRLKHKFLGAVVEEAGKLLNTVDGVIDLSRMDYGQGDLSRESVDISEAIKEACGSLERFCIDQEIEIALEAPGDLSRAFLDKDMVLLLFRNLMETALGLARRSTTIRVALAEDDAFVKTRLEVEPDPDRIGLEPAVHALSGARTIPSEAGSLGLTLQVAKNIVLRHGGRIWAETHDPTRWSLVVLFGKETRRIQPSDLLLEIMTSRPELKRMMALVADMIAKVMNVGRCHLYLEDSSTGNLVLGALSGGGPERMVQKGEGLTGTVYERGGPIILNSQADFAELGIDETLSFERVPCASVPVRLKGRVIGVLTVSDKEMSDQFLVGSDLCLLAALADRIGLALERANGYESARDQFVGAMVAMKSLLEAKTMSVEPKPPTGRPSGGPGQAVRRQEQA